MQDKNKIQVVHIQKAREKKNSPQFWSNSHKSLQETSLLNDTRKFI